jgi:hypothetical protein
MKFDYTIIHLAASVARELIRYILMFIEIGFTVEEL